MESITTTEKSNANIETFTSHIGIAVDRFIAQRQSEFPHATGELSQLLRDIVIASKIISREINRAGLSGIEGMTEEENIQGEPQRMLDIIAEVRFKRALINGGQVCAILSEESDEIIDTGNHNAKYVVAIDPLDGSSNVDVNVSVGTIFSIYKRVSPQGKPYKKEDFLQKGDQQVAAGYILYGPSTMLVYTTGYGVNGFTYESSLGEYFLSHPNIIQPENGEYYSINERDQGEFSRDFKTYLYELKSRKMETRYVGSLVCDFHRNLLKGGVYMYPSTDKYKEGKLRLMYECHALAFLTEQAKGKATNGSARVMDIKPKDIHQRTPIIIGSKKLVDEYEEIRSLICF
ncbi:class 1 fructose-bisphosphatase [Flammeovirga agarivorans]|uniref:Fructose-1,6-bisphosphatase class 1 n=1 Tax=Flammeovirga agarivorans TaxID=2726742 RepID=A0A7X8SNH2_9BACT|nr:class 1 fructose-bisphosphatase [Flammeovirga agarivorans]NLR93446.1 class 1 fructose-bisphosphatase [Flammeovirga agarivorans]